METGNIIFGQPAQGYFLQPSETLSDGMPRHTLGHERFDLRCTRCRRPTEAVLTLDVTDTRLELESLPVETLPLLICREHFHTRIQYSFNTAGDCRAFDSVVHDFSREVPGVTLKFKDPGSVSLHAVPDRITTTRVLAAEGRIAEAADWTGRFDWKNPINQVGGTPAVLGEISQHRDCALCDQPMRFLASVVVEIENERKEDQGIGQLLFFVCRSCAGVACLPDFAAENYS